jgi:hypothetical protein
MSANAHAPSENQSEILGLEDRRFGLSALVFFAVYKYRYYVSALTTPSARSFGTVQYIIPGRLGYTYLAGTPIEYDIFYQIASPRTHNIRLTTFDFKLKYSSVASNTPSNPQRDR